MWQLNDDVEWIFSMDDEVSEGLVTAHKEAAVTMGGTGYAMRNTDVGVGDYKRFARPEGGIVRLFHMMSVLGLTTKDTERVTRGLVATMGAIYGWMMIMGAVRAIMKFRAGVATALAAAETVAQAIAQNWAGIAMAAAGAAAVYTGLKIGEGEWNLPGVGGGHHEKRRGLESALERYRRDEMQTGDLLARSSPSLAVAHYKNAGLKPDEIQRRLRAYGGGVIG